MGLNRRLNKDWTVLINPETTGSRINPTFSHDIIDITISIRGLTKKASSRYYSDMVERLNFVLDHNTTSNENSQREFVRSRQYIPPPPRDLTLTMRHVLEHRPHPDQKHNVKGKSKS